MNRVLCLSRGRSTLLAALLCSAALSIATAAIAHEAGSYLESAHQLEKNRDLHGAEIQLRNAAQAAPANGAIRLELAKIYLALHNPNAAEAELFAAHTRGVKEVDTAPLMGQAMFELGAFGDLLAQLPTGNRPAKVESLVRTYRGMAEFVLGETDRARAMFADAERLDPKSPLPLVSDGRVLIQQHQPDAAQAKIDAALKLDPRNSDALDARGLVLAMRGNTQGALQQLAAAIAADPRNLRAWLDRANLETEFGRLDAAEKDLGQIDKIAQGSVMAVYLQAAIDAQRGKYKDADSLLDRVRGVMSSFPPAYLVAAEVKFQLNQLDLAEAFARKYVSQAGDQAKGYQLLGAIALKRGNLEGGITALEKAAQLAPKDANVLSALGQAYVAHGDLDEAKAAFAEAAVQAPGNASLATERAMADFASGDRAQSVAALSAVFKGGKGSVMAGPPLVIEALQLGQLDVAESAARELLAHDPKSPTYQELLAAVRIGQHDYAGAETLLRGLLAKQPNLTSVRRDLAQIYLSTNRAAQAKALYEDRLRANPKDTESLEALADIAFRRTDDAGAIRLLEQAQAITPDDPRPSLQILGILQTRKRWPEAIGRAQALAAKFAKDARVADALGQLYFASGNRAAADGVYRAATAKFLGNAPIFAHYAGVFAAEKNYVAAIPLALRAVQLDPRNPQLKGAYVTLAYLGKGTDAALAAARAVTGDKTGQAALLMTADVLAANNNRAGAIALLEERQAQSPSGSVATVLASLDVRNSQPAKALTVLESWTKAHPADIEARDALAQVDSQSGRLDQALAQYEWLAAQKPDNAMILNNLAWLYDWKHDPRALATARKAISLAPAAGSVADTLGWILEEQGDLAGAAKYLALASASQPADATIQYHYAVLLSKTGKADQARDLLQKLLKLNVQSETKAQAQLLLVKLSGRE